MTPTPSIELLEHKLTEEYQEFLSDPLIPEEKGKELQQRVEVLSPTKQRSFLDRIAPILEERLKVLEQKQIDINLLKRAREVQEYIDQLLKRLEARVKSITPAAPQETKETFAEKLQKEWEEHPVRTTLTGAVIVLGMLSVGSFIANRFRKAREAGKQAMQTGGSWLKRALIAAGVSLGVFLGLKAYKELKEFKGLLSSLKPERPQPPEVPTPPTVPDALPETDEILDQGRREAITHGLLIMHKEERVKANVQSEADLDALRALVNDSKVLAIPLHEILTIDSKEQAHVLLVPVLPGKPSEAQSKALYFFSLVCRREQQQIQQMLTTEEHPIPFQELTLGDVLERRSHLARLFHDVTRGLNGSSWTNFDLERFQASLFSEQALTDINQNPAIRAQLFESLPLSKERRAAFIVYCISPVRKPLLKDVQASDEPRDIHAALVHIRNTLNSEDTLNYFARFTHQRREDFAPVLLEHIRTNLTILDAVQLYTYLQLSKGRHDSLPVSLRDSSPIGALFLQMKVLDLVCKASSKEKKEGIHMGSYLMFEAVKQGENLEMPIETIEMLRKIASLAGKTFFDYGMDALQEQAENWWIRFQEFRRANPYGLAYAADAGGVGALGLIGLAWRRWLKRSWSDKLADRLGFIEREGKGFFSRLRTNLRPESINKILRESTGARIRLVDTGKLIKALGKDGEELLQAYNKFAKSGFHQQSFDDFRKVAQRMLTQVERVGDVEDIGRCKQILRNVDIMASEAKVYQYGRFYWWNRLYHYATGRGAYNPAQEVTSVVRARPAVPSLSAARIAAGAESLDVAAASASAAKPPSGAKPDLRVIRPDGTRLNASGEAIGGADDAVKVSAEAAEQFSDAKALLKEIQAAKKAGNDARLAELLKHPLLETAAKQGDKEAKVLLKASTWAKVGRVGKYVSRGLIGLGMAIDAYLIFDNERRIKTASPGERQILKARRISLGASAGGGVGLLFLSGGALAIGAPVLIGGSLYAEAIYDAILEWEKEGEDHLHLDPLEIRRRLDELTIGYVNIGHRTGVGDSAITYAWKHLFWSKERLDEDVENKLNTIEGINRNTRMALLTAYFMKHLTVPREPHESDKSFISRVKRIVLDRLKYISILTKGTYHMGFLGPRFYEHADAYGEILEMKREREARGLPLAIEYEWNGERKLLDLEKLRPENCTEQEGMRILHQYQEELKPQLSFARILLRREFLFANGSTEGVQMEIEQLVRAELLQGLHHSIYSAEERIREEKFSGNDDWKRIVVRVALREELEGVIRECVAAFRSTEDINPEQVASYHNRLKSVLTQAYKAQDVFSRSYQKYQGKSLKGKDNTLLELLS